MRKKQPQIPCVTRPTAPSRKLGYDGLNDDWFGPSPIGRARSAASARNPTLANDEVLTETRAPPGQPAFYTIGEIAKILRIDARTIRRRLGKGLIRKAPMSGRVVRIPATEVVRLMSGEPLPPSENQQSDPSITEFGTTLY